jgi:hypothetical protein
MVNGVDRNFVRLVICTAAYRAQFGEWPSEARLAPALLWDIGHLLGLVGFEALARRLQLSSAEEVYLLEVRGEAGVRSYEGIDISNDVTDADCDEALRWLGVDARPDL